MYNETSAKMPTMAVQKVQDPPLEFKVKELLDGACAIRNSAETIRGKLFGQQPQCEESMRGPSCIEGVLDDIREVLQEAGKILNVINERT